MDFCDENFTSFHEVNIGKLPRNSKFISATRIVYNNAPFISLARNLISTNSLRAQIYDENYLYQNGKISRYGINCLIDWLVGYCDLTPKQQYFSYIQAMNMKWMKTLKLMMKWKMGIWYQNLTMPYLFVATHTIWNQFINVKRDSYDKMRTDGRKTLFPSLSESLTMPCLFVATHKIWNQSINVKRDSYDKMRTNRRKRLFPSLSWV